MSINYTMRSVECPSLDLNTLSRINTSEPLRELIEWLGNELKHGPGESEPLVIKFWRTEQKGVGED